ncbi:potassium channel family protein [Luethyella okanaganae]|uniref:Potassium channel family protein n=1 Tax=Luethyella okanaganae TaxID=69372 RepID=A0ABW1VBE8_9MICO
MSDTSPSTRWEEWTTWPLLVMSLVFIASYSIIVLRPELPTAVLVALHLLNVVIWICFAVDYLTRLVRSHRRWWFVRNNVPDLLSVIVPIFRPFRLLTYLHKVPFFRAASGAAVRIQLLIQALCFVVLFVYVIALAELQVERDADGATITTFGDAVWWACVTIATVGYGDMYPVTPPGRLLAVVLMIGGIAIVGTASATVISYLNERASGRKRR